MDENLLLKGLASGTDNAARLTEEIAGNTSLLPAVMGGISAREARVKYKSMKVLSLISRKSPRVLYPYFDVFVHLLESSNNIVKWNAIDIIANLTTVDAESRFEKMVDRFYGLVNEGSLITSAHVVESSDIIAGAKPHLRDRITGEILKVENIPLPTEECRNILRGKAILTLARYYAQIEDKEPVIAFVRMQLTCSRHATGKKAETFLKKVKITTK
jgi:hypothetical protein